MRNARAMKAAEIYALSRLIAHSGHAASALMTEATSQAKRKAGNVLQALMSYVF